MFSPPSCKKSLAPPLVGTSPPQSQLILVVSEGLPLCQLPQLFIIHSSVLTSPNSQIVSDGADFFFFLIQFLCALPDYPNLILCPYYPFSFIIITTTFTKKKKNILLHQQKPSTPPNGWDLRLSNKDYRLVGQLKKKSIICNNSRVICIKSNLFLNLIQWLQIITRKSRENKMKINTEIEEMERTFDQLMQF